MTTKKYIVLCIVFLIVMPAKMLLAQDIANDTVQSELDIRYDSILAKASSSLTASQYEQSINYYKEAIALKPAETYGYKMINYVQDLATKQKRADDLKRRWQIKNAFMQANQAITNRNWDSAKILFNEVLSLRPEKAEEEFARSKVASIDLELQRIAARVPPKVEVPVVVPPRNKREARALRKLAERNAILASAANRDAALRQKQTQADATFVASARDKKQAAVVSAPTPATVATAPAKKINYQLLQHFNEDFKNATDVKWTLNTQFAKAEFLQDDEKVEAFYDVDGTLIGSSRSVSLEQIPKDAKRIFATKYASYKIKEVMRYEGGDESEPVSYYVTTEDEKEKVVFKLQGAKDIAVFYREPVAAPANLAAATAGKPSNTALPEKAATPVASPKSQQVQPQAAQADVTKNVATASTTLETNKPIQQKSVQPVQTQPLPRKVSGTIDTGKSGVIQQKPTTLPPTRNVAATSSPRDTNKAILQKPTQITATNTTAALSTPAAGTVTPQKPAETRPLARTGVASAATGQMQQGLPTTGSGVAATSPSAEGNQQKYLQSLAGVGDPNALGKDTQQKAQPLFLDDAITANPTDELPEKTADGRPLKLSDSSDYVKLICQDISFIGSNAYIKILIQNYSETTNFSTDTLHVSIKKNNGTIKRLDQRFISNFPVVMPLKETVLVSFADASANVEPDDIFILEMQDRIRKTRLVVQVPWSVYNQRKNL